MKMEHAAGAHGKSRSFLRFPCMGFMKYSKKQPGLLHSSHRLYSDGTLVYAGTDPNGIPPCHEGTAFMEQGQDICIQEVFSD